MKTTFLIFSQSRSGSTLLKDLLNSHPKINCEGEILSLSDGYFKKTIFLKVARFFPLPFIYFRKSRSPKEIYGFTLFNYHIKYIKFYLPLLNRLGWKIIYLCRRDIIEQSFSAIVAKHTKVFHNREGKIRENVRLKISEDEFLKMVKQRVYWHNRELNVLKSCKYLSVFYENNLREQESWEDGMNKIFNFLEAGESPVKSNLEKTYPEPYSDIVENYYELVQAFKQSPMHYLNTRD